jgi:hypothetical protein
LAISYLAPFDGDVYLEDTLGCILRKHTIYSFDKDVEFWREIIFNLYVFRRFTPLSTILCNKNCNAVLITAVTTSEQRVPTP